MTRNLIHITRVEMIIYLLKIPYIINLIREVYGDKII